jgi:hypothetical protein
LLCCFSQSLGVGFLFSAKKITSLYMCISIASAPTCISKNVFLYNFQFTYFEYVFFVFLLQIQRSDVDLILCINKEWTFLHYKLQPFLSHRPLCVCTERRSIFSSYFSNKTNFRFVLLFIVCFLVLHIAFHLSSMLMTVLLSLRSWKLTLYFCSSSGVCCYVWMLWFSASMFGIGLFLLLSVYVWGCTFCYLCMCEVVPFVICVCVR